MIIVIQSLDGIQHLKEAYSHKELNSKLFLTQQKSFGALNQKILLSLRMISQLTKSFSFIINLITFTKTTEDMWNQDQTHNLTEEIKNSWLLQKLKVIAIQFIKTPTFGKTNNTLMQRCKPLNLKLLLRQQVLLLQI